MKALKILIYIAHAIGITSCILIGNYPAVGWAISSLVWFCLFEGEVS